MLPTPFWVPWVEIDPALKHGGIPDELASGWVGPRLGDNMVTKNQDMLRIFNCVRDAAADLSMMPNANVEGPPLRGDLEDILKAWAWVCERITDRTTTYSNRIFQWTHSTPPEDAFLLRPIRYPLRNDTIGAVVYHLLGTMGEVAESNANGYHSRVDFQSSHKIIAPLWHVKANIMRDWFDTEIAGEISPEELQQLVGQLQLRTPTISPPGETAERASAEAVAEAKTGTDVISWYPEEKDWVKYDQKTSTMYIPKRIMQPEAAMSTTEDVAPPIPVPPVAEGQPT